MKITYDPAKRAKALEERGLDFEDAVEAFEGETLDQTDDRQDYGEERIITAGHLRGRMVIIVWTPRPTEEDPGTRHVISMRKANDREQTRFGQRLEEG
jgi:uncharacterized DUF497 family protein